MYRKLMHILLVINLSFLALILLSRIQFLTSIGAAVTKTFLTPLFISVLIYYIIRPMNNIFLKKGMKNGRASMITLLIFCFILSGILSFFSRYAYSEFQQIARRLWRITYNAKQIDGVMNRLNQFIDFRSIIPILAANVQYYFVKSGHLIIKCVKYCFNTFSMLFLIIVLLFYLLRDGYKLKGSILKFIPQKFKNIAADILAECDEILSHYVTGQAKVAFSLAFMIFFGYIVIGMPDALLLAGITFILAFIPFVGFFISMIIPSVIALSMGYLMILKLIAVFIIVQTLKGRIVVPLVMSKTMDIHPITDICLVIIAVAVGGPMAAFVVVPIYAIIKSTVINVRKFNQHMK